MLNHDRQDFLSLLVRKACIHLLNDAIQLGNGRGTFVDHLQKFGFLEREPADGLHERLNILVRLVCAWAGEEVIADLSIGGRRQVYNGSGASGTKEDRIEARTSFMMVSRFSAFMACAPPTRWCSSV
jgi:hypothetical protein